MASSNLFSQTWIGSLRRNMATGPWNNVTKKTPGRSPQQDASVNSRLREAGNQGEKKDGKRNKMGERHQSETVDGVNERRSGVGIAKCS